MTITAPFPISPTTPLPVLPPPGDIHHGVPVNAGLVTPDDAGIAPALLPMMDEVNSHRVSISRGRGHTSGEPRRTHHYLAPSLPSPTVAMNRAARRSSVGRPTTYANATLAAAPPRPGPASLLSSSSLPQPGSDRQQGGRAGTAPRAASRAGIGTTTVGLGYARVGTPDAGAVVPQVP